MPLTAPRKALALSARTETRDYVDIVELRRAYPLAAICRAACGKGPGFTPLSLLKMMRRFARIDPAKLEEIQAWKLDSIALKMAWIELSDEAEVEMVRLADERPELPIGVAFVDGQFHEPGSSEARLRPTSILLSRTACSAPIRLSPRLAHDGLEGSLEERSQWGQILCLLWSPALTADEGVERIPIGPTEPFERLLGIRGGVAAGGQHHTPVGGRKRRLAAWAASVVWTVHYRANDNLHQRDFGSSSVRVAAARLVFPLRSGREAGQRRN
jgi:hypothetical protein